MFFDEYRGVVRGMKTERERKREPKAGRSQMCLQKHIVRVYKLRKMNGRKLKTSNVWMVYLHTKEYRGFVEIQDTLVGIFDELNELLCEKSQRRIVSTWCLLLIPFFFSTFLTFRFGYVEARMSNEWRRENVSLVPFFFLELPSPFFLPPPRFLYKTKRDIRREFVNSLILAAKPAISVPCLI